MSQQKKSNTLWIGSWNVHAWYDGKGNPNFERISKALKVTPVDIIGFQEACREAPAGEGT